MPCNETSFPIHAGFGRRITANLDHVKMHLSVDIRNRMRLEYHLTVLRSFSLFEQHQQLLKIFYFCGHALY